MPLQVAVGDKILLPPYGGTPVKVLQEVNIVFLGFFLLKRGFCF